MSWRTSDGHDGLWWLTRREETFQIPQPLNSSTSDWLKLNLNETAYMRVNYMQSNWRALANALRRRHTVQIWQTPSLFRVFTSTNEFTFSLCLFVSRITQQKYSNDIKIGQKLLHGPSKKRLDAGCNADPYAKCLHVCVICDNSTRYVMPFVYYIVT